MAKPSPLDDPENAAYAWARYRRLMRLMMGITLATVIIALAIIYKQVDEVSPHFFIATALGIGFTMLLMSALMGLVFLSSGTGHDSRWNTIWMSWTPTHRARIAARWAGRKAQSVNRAAAGGGIPRPACRRSGVPG